MKSKNAGDERNAFLIAKGMKTMNDRLVDMKDSLMTIGESDKHRKHEQELIAAQINQINVTLGNVIKNQMAISSQISVLTKLNMRVFSLMDTMSQRQPKELELTIQKEFESLKKSILQQLKTSKKKGKKRKRTSKQLTTSDGSSKEKQQNKWMSHRIPDWREYYKGI
uniref:Uncharacterized protein n=2 Tax=Lygus hesperus TaxID=30085 RepID=A0A0K8TB19_LYGHE